jgi:dTDP-4-dehydrorhamnose reductase
MGASTLIVGSDGQLGSALMRYLREKGVRVIGTTKRPDRLDETRLHLDLLGDMQTWRCPFPIAVAVICAGVTKTETCRLNPIQTARINVGGTSDLVRNLVESRAFVIFLSTNLVFDGSDPFRLPSDEVSPVTEYGRQKAETEQRIRVHGTSVAVVRFTKILGPTGSLLNSWAQSMKRSERIQPYSDMYMSPVPISFAVSVLAAVAENRLPGILQVSGDRDISYAEAAFIGARTLGVDEGLVQPVSAVAAGRYVGPIPANTTLNTSRLKRELGMRAPDVETTVEKAFLDPAALGLHRGMDYATPCGMSSPV